MRNSVAWAVVVCALAGLATTATSQPVTQGAQVSAATHFDVSPALRDLPAATDHVAPVTFRRPLPVPPLGGVPGAVAAIGGAPPARKMPTATVNVLGLGTSFPGFTFSGAPSDANIAVGPNHLVQAVNTMFAVFDKSGAVIGVPHSIKTLWAGFGGLCEVDNDGDPIVQYDRLADRWLVTQFAVTGTTTHYLQCVAVSTTADPTGTYFRYAFDYGSSFPDYAKAGVWPDAYYFAYNMFDATTAPPTFLAGQVCALDRAKMLVGMAATQQCFLRPTEDSLLPADLDGATPPPAGAPNYLINLHSFSSIGLFKFHVDWATPANSALTGPTVLAVTNFAQLSTCDASANCVPQLGTSQMLDQLDDRMMYRLAYRNYGTHESLVTNHTVAAGDGAGVRWYEVRSPGAGPVVFQEGTYAPGDNRFRWMGSIAMDQDGNMAAGFSVSDATIFPQIHYTGRLVGDPAGTMGQGEASIIDGTGAQLATSGRWGDYTSMRIDPSDDCTFWYTNQYQIATASFSWSTRIAAFKFPSCGAVAGATPIFQSAASRKVHGAAGTFDLPLSTVAPPGINHNPTIEPRIGPAQTIVFTFDKPLNGATVTVTEGTATAGAPAFSGLDVVVALTGVTNEQYVTVALTNVTAVDGGTGGAATVRVGFLACDVNQSRAVSIADLGLVNAQLSQVVTAANYLKDVNFSGTLTVADKGITNANLTKSLPTP